MALSIADLKALAEEYSQGIGPNVEQSNNAPAKQIIAFEKQSPLDEAAKKAGFLILASEEAYEQRLTMYHSVFIFLESSSWYCYKVTWKPGKSMATKEESFGRNLPFKTALNHSMEYINWFRSRQS